MASVYSKQLAFVHGTDYGTEYDFPMPVGVDWVVRDISAYANTGLLGSDLLVFDLVTGTAFFYAGWEVSDQHSVHWEGRVVIPAAPGSGIGIKGGEDAVDVIVSGYALRTP